MKLLEMLSYTMEVSDGTIQGIHSFVSYIICFILITVSNFTPLAILHPHFYHYSTDHNVDFGSSSTVQAKSIKFRYSKQSSDLGHVKVYSDDLLIGTLESPRLYCFIMGYLVLNMNSW